MSFAGAILDVDGVLVDSPHERAWRDTLRELMESDWRDIRRRTSYAPERFTHELYQPQHETNLRIHLDEYLRYDLEAGFFYAT